MSTAVPSYFANLSTRKAFAIHLTLSLLIFSSLVFVMLMWWFPGELFFLDGGWQGLKLVALIDLVLGPMLTLVLYKPGKKSLVFDMSCIAAFQIAALAYGFYATHQQRTVAVVFADRNFTTLSASSASVAATELLDLEIQPQNIKALDNAYPALLLTPEPEPGKFGEYVSQLFNGYPESHERLDLFEKLDEQHHELLIKRAKPQADLETTGADVIVAEAIAKGNFDEDDIEVHHFKARYAQGLVLYSKNKKDIVDYIPIDWDVLVAERVAEQEPENATTDNGVSTVEASSDEEIGIVDSDKPQDLAETTEEE